MRGVIYARYSSDNQREESIEGQIRESVLEGMAEYYYADLAEKVSRGMTENALKARFNGGQIPLGFTIDDEHHYQIDPEKTPLVIEMFRRYAGGESITDIVEDLNARGIRTSQGESSREISADYKTVLRNVPIDVCR